MKQIYVGSTQRAKLYTAIRKAILPTRIVLWVILALLVIIPVSLSSQFFVKSHMGMSNVVEINALRRSGSAVLISNDQLLTCAHVVEGMRVDEICEGAFIDPKNPDKLSIKFKARLVTNGTFYPSENSSEDFALLEIVDSEIPVERITTPCQLGSSKKMEDKNKIFIVGYPEGGYLVTDGIISNIHGGIYNDDHFIVSVDNWYGNDGALLNEANQLIGLVTQRGVRHNLKDCQVYVLKLDQIRWALSKKGYQI